MAQNLKPIIDELKSKLQNREAMMENLKQTRETVEKTLKQVAQQTKDSRIVHEYVIPMVESEKADQALKFLNAKLGANPVVSKLEKARKAIIELKVSQAKPAAEASVSDSTNVESAAQKAKEAATSLNDDTQKM